MSEPARLWFARHGYHDSYFYVVYFNDETGKIGQHMYGATAFAGGDWADIVRHKDGVPAEVLEAARKALAEVIFSALRAVEHCDVLTPSVARHGEVMRVLSNSTARCKSVYKAGDVGDVFWSQAIGRFCKNGYNQPGRENTRVGLRLLDGSKIFLPLKSLRLHREPMTDAELRSRAEELSHGYNFGAVVSGYTWPSEVFFRRPKAVGASS